MASLGISDLSDSSDSDGGSLNDPESIHEPDPPPGPMTSDPMTSGQVGETKVAGDSEWDSTAASDVNTPRGVIARGDVSTPRDVEELHMDKSPVKTQVGSLCVTPMSCCIIVNVLCDYKGFHLIRSLLTSINFYHCYH